MAGARFLAPAVPLIVVVGMGAIEVVTKRKAVTVVAGSLLILANLFCYVRFVHAGEGEGRPAWWAWQAAKRFRERTGEHRFSFVELANKQHVRDAITVRRLLPVIDEAVQNRTEPLSIMSGQAGMIAYYVFASHFGKVQFLDLWSLTTRELYDCLSPEIMPPTMWGTSHDLPTIFKQRKQLESCGLRTPDIFVNECLSQHVRKWLGRNGYVLVFNQVGAVKSHESEEVERLVPGRMAACGFIAVHKPLAKQLGLKPARDWRWNLNPGGD